MSSARFIVDIAFPVMIASGLAYGSSAFGIATNPYGGRGAGGNLQPQQVEVKVEQ